MPGGHVVLAVAITVHVGVFWNEKSFLYLKDEMIWHVLTIQKVVETHFYFYDSKLLLMICSPFYALFL